jgi:hypothetical protein
MMHYKPSPGQPVTCGATGDLSWTTDARLVALLADFCPVCKTRVVYDETTACAKDVRVAGSVRYSCTRSVGHVGDCGHNVDKARRLDEARRRLLSSGSGIIQEDPRDKVMPTHVDHRTECTPEARVGCWVCQDPTGARACGGCRSACARHLLSDRTHATLESGAKFSYQLTIERVRNLIRPGGRSPGRFTADDLLAVLVDILERHDEAMKWGL